MRPILLPEEKEVAPQPAGVQGDDLWAGACVCVGGLVRQSINRSVCGPVSAGRCTRETAVIRRPRRSLHANTHLAGLAQRGDAGGGHRVSSAAVAAGCCRGHPVRWNFV